MGDDTRGRDLRVLGLTWAAGCIDAIGYLGLGHVFTANMTGNTVLLGLAIGQAHVRAVLRTLVALGGFAGGLALGALVVGHAREAAPWPAGVTRAVALEMVLLGALALSWALTGEPREPGTVHALIALCALAMGIQSAAVRRLSVPGIVTTYITGTLTSIVLGLVPRWSDDPDASPAMQWERRHTLQALVFGVYGVAALVSGMLHARRPTLVMALPFLAVAAVVAGAARRAPARLAVVAVALLLAGCATEVALAPPARSVPDLRGTWTGTWGGTPVTLVVLSQEEAYDSGTVAVGPWTLAGYPLPGVSGVMTFSIDGKATTVNVRGRVGDRDGRLTLVLGPLTAHGEQIVLARVGEDRLRGTGVSRATWEPQGPIELARRPRD